jgi:hypothetical protein
MEFFKKMGRAILILSISTLNLYPFEQNGVKDGNIKISASLYSNQEEDKYDTMNFNSQVGYFYNSSVEFLVGLQIDIQQNELYYTLSPGINYYFYKTPIITPYIGGQIFYKNTSNEYIREKKGNTFYLGTHLFVSEDIAVTPEFGVRYLEFETKKGTYFNTFLTYFF